MRRLPSAIWGLYNIGRVFIHRALPILTFAVMFMILASITDRYHVQHQSASDFVNYYSFTVNNARAGEDVYFQVCRVHNENYAFNGDLSIYIYRNADPKSEPTKVYSQEIGGFLRDGNCENKVLRATAFKHDPGTYKMAFCIDFLVKYNIHKHACKDSNIYKIYPVPNDLNAQIKYFQSQIDILETQVKEGSGNAPPADLKATDQESEQASNSGQAPTTTNPQPDVPAPSVSSCKINLLSACIIR